jgi:uncharacterized protein (DUF1800 family)
MRQFTKYWKFSVIIWLLVVLPSSAATSPDSKILHILNRLSFGPKPGDIERVREMGVDSYIEAQLSPKSIPESSELKAQLETLDTLNLNPLVLAEQYSRFRRKPGIQPTPEEIKATSNKQRQVLEQSVKARLLRATLSDRQLEEVMVDFWFNHFNVYANKGLDRIWVGTYEQQAIRPHVFGKFRDLLGATAHHPAMLFYLDNWRNTAPRNPTARGRSQGLNENYARELMELHTLGAGGGYTQADVVALAKILTGWGFPARGTVVDNASPQGFYFNPKRHDFSDKTFLGQQIKGSGEAEGEQALDILASHPATARRISERLAQYFVADKPPEALVKRLTQRYISTDGNIREILKTLFDSPEFQDPKVYQAKFKTPYRYVLSAIRATGVEVRNVQPINNALRQLGMPLYGSLAPDGYKNTEDAWLNPDAINRRISFATSLANGRLPLTATQPKSLPPKPRNSALGTPVNPQQLAQTLGNGFSSKTQQAIANKPPNLQAALMLGSPEFMRH